MSASEQFKSNWIHVLRFRNSKTARTQFAGVSAEVIIKKKRAQHLLAAALVKVTHA